MEIAFSSRDMTRAMGIVSRATGRSSGLPVLASVLSALSQDDVKLTTSGDKARIRCGKGEYRIAGIPAEEFPSLMDRSDAVEVGLQENRMVFCMGDTVLVSALLAGSYQPRSPLHILSFIYLSSFSSGKLAIGTS